MRCNLAFLIVCGLSAYTVGGNLTYSFEEQQSKGYIWNGEQLVITSSTEDLVDSFFFKNGGDIISLGMIKIIEKSNRELSSKIIDIQSSFYRCKVNQHINSSTITAYIGSKLICIEGNGYSFNTIADDQYLGLHLKKLGTTFQYESVLGSTNTIEKYEIRDISKERKETYQYFLLRVYLNGVQKDIQAGYIDLSHCSDCFTCKGTSLIDCSDCLGTGQIEKHKVISSETIMDEVDKEVAQKMQVYKDNYNKKKLRMSQSGSQRVMRPMRSSSSTGDRLSLEKEENELEKREMRMREMVLEKVNNEKVPCPYCDAGRVLCPAHEYKTIVFKEACAGILESRQNKRPEL